MSDQQSIADGIEQCKPMLLRFLDGFDDASRTRQTPHQPNHVAWTLGHCALTMHRAAGHFDDGSLPESAFIADQFAGDSERFGVESVVRGSTPRPDPDLYPRLECCVSIYESACDRLADVVRCAEARDLNAVVESNGDHPTARDLLFALIFHNGTHCGQIIDLRRALEMPNILR